MAWPDRVDVTPEEVEAAIAEAQSKWTEEQRLKRIVGGGSGRVEIKNVNNRTLDGSSMRPRPKKEP